MSKVIEDDEAFTIIKYLKQLRNTRNGKDKQLNEFLLQFEQDTVSCKGKSVLIEDVI